MPKIYDLTAPSPASDFAHDRDVPRPPSWVADLDHFGMENHDADGIEDLCTALEYAVRTRARSMDLRHVSEDALTLALPDTVVDALRQQLERIDLPVGVEPFTAQLWSSVTMASGRSASQSPASSSSSSSPSPSPSGFDPFRSDLQSRRRSLTPVLEGEDVGAVCAPVVALRPNVPARPTTLQLASTTARFLPLKASSPVQVAQTNRAVPVGKAPAPNEAPSPSAETLHLCGALHERLCRKAEPGARHPTVLDRRDLQPLQRLMQAPSAAWAPPSTAGLLEHWPERVETALRQPLRQAQTMRLNAEEVRELSAVMRDLLACGGVKRTGAQGWRPKNPGELAATAALAAWMGATGSPPAREALGRALLEQHAGLRHDLDMGQADGTQALDWPDTALLHELMHPMTRVHLTLGDDPDQLEGLGESLMALPLRSWRLSGASVLPALMAQQRSSVALIDLTQAGSRLTAQDETELRDALPHLPNLEVVVLPAGTDARLLGSDWTARPGKAGREYRPVKERDGLTLLDAAVQAWGGYYLSSRMAIRRQANHPDVRLLLQCAAHLGAGTGQDAAVGQQLQRILDQCARDTHCLKRCGEALRGVTMDTSRLKSVLARLTGEGPAPSQQAEKSTAL